MAAKRTTPEEREEAFTDFMEGFTLRQIAQKYGVKERTVKGWYERDNWGEKRRQARADAEKTVFNHYRQKIADTISEQLEVVKLGSKLLAKAMTKIFNEVDNDPGLLDEKLKKVGEVAKYSAEVSKALKYAMPHASEELSTLIYEELKRIGAAGLLDKNGND